MKKRAVTALIEAIAITSSAAFGAATALQRNVQIIEVNFEDSTVTLKNLHPSLSISLTGWQFCTHDESENRRYSNSGGLNGISLAAGETLTVHYLDDAGGAGGAVNRSTIGGNFALPLDSGAYAIGLYNEDAGFNDGTNIVDHIQWSIGGADNTSADERSDEAVTEGNVWASETAWISTTVETLRIELTIPDGSDPEQGPADYTVLEPAPGPSSVMVKNIAKTGATVVADIEWLGGNVDVYRSSDLTDFGGTALMSDIAPGIGVLIDSIAPAGRAFYRIVPTGDPAP